LESDFVNRLILIFTAILIFPFSSFAAAACYTQAEAEAEQGIRIHSELMVIGLNCQHMGARHGMNLYGQYREFTTRHAKLFSTYETMLMNYFKKAGHAKPESSLITLRTNFANKISNDAADMRPDVFCSEYAARIEQAHKMDEKAVRQWAAKIYPSHPVSRPMCKS
jgi:hypothetical protein